MFFGAERYVSTLENIRFRGGRRNNKIGISQKTGLRFPNSFPSFEKPFLFCTFALVIKANAYENETVVMELGGHSRSVQSLSVRHTMDGPCR